MAFVTISQTWPDGSTVTVQVGHPHRPDYPDELAQLGAEARRTWRNVIAEDEPAD